MLKQSPKYLLTQGPLLLLIPLRQQELYFEIKELQEETKNIESGEFLTEEEFERKHKVKIN